MLCKLLTQLEAIFLQICLLCTQVFGVSVSNPLPGTHEDVRSVNVRETELQSPSRHLHGNVLLRNGERPESYPNGANQNIGNMRPTDENLQAVTFFSKGGDSSVQKFLHFFFIVSVPLH